YSAARARSGTPRANASARRLATTFVTIAMAYPPTVSNIRIGKRRRRSYSRTSAIPSYAIETGSATRTTSSGWARPYAATKLRRSWLIRGRVRRLAVRARRPGARVGRLLEELVLGRGPELADVLDRERQPVLDLSRGREIG